jgi:hypothetical protein
LAAFGSKVTSSASGDLIIVMSLNSFNSLGLLIFRQLTYIYLRILGRIVFGKAYVYPPQQNLTNVISRHKLWSNNQLICQNQTSLACQAKQSKYSHLGPLYT